MSSAAARRALELGIELSLLTRGLSASVRPLPRGVRVLTADARDPSSVAEAISGETFDVVVDFIAFVPEHIDRDVELFTGRTHHYIFISSASVYEKPFQSWPVVESNPVGNPYWRYARDKIGCEERVREAHRRRGFPATIVRPSHTYDRTLLPFGPHGSGGATLRRIQEGRPIVVHGDGTSLWTLTHQSDFALGLVGLLGKQESIGETYHITSERAQTWDQIARIFADLAGVEPNIVHVPTDIIARYHSEWGASLLGDKAHSALFDCGKVRALVPEFSPRVPFERGAVEIYDYYSSSPERLAVDPEVDRLIDELSARFSASRWGQGEGL